MTLRIIAGKHRGRKIFMKEGKDIRPTGARAREGVFNILLHGRFSGIDNSPLVGKRVVDLFCGSGALGLEALSRGAAQVTFVDQSSDSIALVRHNVDHLGETGNAKFVRSDSANLPASTQKFTLAFMDPPYKTELATKALESLHKNKWLEPDAVVVVEVSKTQEISPPAQYDVFDLRDYGNNRIYFLNYTPDKE